MAHISSRGSKCLGQLRRFHRQGRFKEHGRKNQPFQKAQAVFGKNLRGQRLEPPSRAVDRKHGTFLEKCIDTHGFPIIVYQLNYSKQYQIVLVDRTMNDEDYRESQSMPTPKAISIAVCILLAACATAAFAQNSPAPQPAPLPQPSETMVVLGSPVPTPLAESPSSVLVLPVESNILSLETEQDLLRP